jgi:hypothetical protein
MYMNHNKYKDSREGGVALRVIVCVVSLLALAAVIFLLLKTFEADKAEDYRKAGVISDYGLEEAFAKLYADFGWDDGFAGEPYQDGVYDVSVTRENRGDTLYIKIVSTGAAGSISKVQEHTLRLVISGEDTVLVK